MPTNPSIPLSDRMRAQARLLSYNSSPEEAVTKHLLVAGAAQIDLLRGVAAADRPSLQEVATQQNIRPAADRPGLQECVAERHAIPVPGYVHLPPADPTPQPPAAAHTGNKYRRKVRGAWPDDTIDVYAVLASFEVACPAVQHAVKKLLCAGLRGKNDRAQDLREAGDAISRAIQMAEETK